MIFINTRVSRFFLVEFGVTTGVGLRWDLIYLTAIFFIIIIYNIIIE